MSVGKSLEAQLLQAANKIADRLVDYYWMKGWFHFDRMPPHLERLAEAVQVASLQLMNRETYSYVDPWLINRARRDPETKRLWREEPLVNKLGMTIAFIRTWEMFEKSHKAADDKSLAKLEIERYKALFGQLIRSRATTARVLTGKAGKDIAGHISSFLGSRRCRKRTYQAKTHSLKRRPTRKKSDWLKRRKHRSSKFERCVVHLKRKQSRWCRSRKYPRYKRDPKGRKCYNPWAVCARLRGK
jgi:hypothetical protein